jgi:hypothetical protein
MIMFDVLMYSIRCLVSLLKKSVEIDVMNEKALKPFFEKERESFWTLIIKQLGLSVYIAVLTISLTIIHCVENSCE